MNPTQAVQVGPRLEMFRNSLKSLFFHPDAPKTCRVATPAERASGRCVRKVTTTDHPIEINLGPRVRINGQTKGLQLKLPKGMPLTVVGSINLQLMVKKIMGDIAKAKSPTEGFLAFQAKIDRLFKSGPANFERYLRQQNYLNCGKPQNQSGKFDRNTHIAASSQDIEEDTGHAFLRYNASAADQPADQELNDKEYKSLEAFLMLL